MVPHTLMVLDSNDWCCIVVEDVHGATEQCMVGQSNVRYYLVMLISNCSQMYSAVVITANANVGWAYRSVMQTFQSCIHMHSTQAFHMLFCITSLSVLKN